MRLRKLLACTVLAHPRIRNVNFPSFANSKPLWFFRKSCGFLEGRRWFPREPPPYKGGGGEVEIWPAYTNQGSPARPSLWMPLPLPASPYKGEETAWRPHKPEEPFLLDFEHFITNITRLRWDVQRGGGASSGLTRYGHAKQVM